MLVYSKRPRKHLRHCSSISAAGSGKSCCGAERCSCEAESKGNSCAAGEGTSAGASDSCQPRSDPTPCRGDWDPAGAYGRFPGSEGMQRHRPCSVRPYLSRLQKFRISVHKKYALILGSPASHELEKNRGGSSGHPPCAWECESPGHPEVSPEIVGGWLTMILHAGPTSANDQEARE